MMLRVKELNIAYFQFCSEFEKILSSSMVFANYVMMISELHGQFRKISVTNFLSLMLHPLTFEIQFISNSRIWPIGEKAFEQRLLLPQKRSGFL